MFRAPLTFSRVRYPLLSRQLGRNTSSLNPKNNASPVTRRGVARATLGLFTVSSMALVTTIYADVSMKDNNPIAPSSASLVRAYFVYTMCSIPALVDASPTILSTLSSVPGVKQITEAFVRVTFFNHFVGADTADEAIPLLHDLRKANKGVLFAYSVEVDENEATLGAQSELTHASDAHKRIVNEMLHCIDVAADFEDGLVNAEHTASRRTWVAVKFTALLPDASALTALSSYIVNSRKVLPRSASEAMVPFPGAARVEDMDVVLHFDSSLSNTPTRDPHNLTPVQIGQLRELYGDLVRICRRAKEKGVKIIVDAEYSWYQPAIDALTLALMREFNSLKSAQDGEVQPLVYGTFQAYLRRTPAHLAVALEDARKHNYALGVKLVRGAYHPHELAAHGVPSQSISPDAEPPVWREKRDTDEAYDRCVRMLIKAVKNDLEKSSVANIPHKPTTPARRGSWFGSLLGGSSSSSGISTGLSTTPSTVEPSTPTISVLFGTHNWKSCDLILDELVRNGLAIRTVPVPGQSVEKEDEPPIILSEEVVDRVAVGQLYGMSDDLTDWVVGRTISKTPFVLKYLPYGALADVMPYLSRRAIENKSVLGSGAAAHERQRAGREIRRRLFG